MSSSSKVKDWTVVQMKPVSACPKLIWIKQESHCIAFVVDNGHSNRINKITEWNATVIYEYTVNDVNIFDYVSIIGLYDYDFSAVFPKYFDYILIKIELVNIFGKNSDIWLNFYWILNFLLKISKSISTWDVTQLNFSFSPNRMLLFPCWLFWRIDLTTSE